MSEGSGLAGQGGKRESRFSLGSGCWKEGTGTGRGFARQIQSILSAVEAHCCPAGLEPF